jgi:hypothetical protein
MSEPKRIYLGTVSLDDDEKTIAFTIPANLSADEIAATTERANLEKAEAQARESKRIAELFPIEGKPHE